MPDLDKNYLAGLYLDEITLDVMPQEYIDAALEVKLRYDACAPRAGYVCVQDRRVKGGFYYRKAPQGQGVNALPPSKLERALARSQEPPKSEMGFLSKAVIGAGLAVGGLALTGAVVNAGRSSEPYQEPVRQRPTPPPSNTARNVAVGVGAAATVGLGVGAAIANKSTPPANTDIKEVEPIVEQVESTPVTKPQKTQEVRTPEAQSAYEAEQPKIQALKELVSVNYPAQKRGYELALAAELKRKQLLPEEIERKKQNLELADDEGYVRIDDVKARAGNGIVNKVAREKQSVDLQRLYDKLKEHGLEGSIQFRGAIDKKKGTPLAESANQYSIDLRDGKGVIRVGEMRFTRNQDKIQEAIAENIKNPQAKSRSTEKAAKPPKTQVDETPNTERLTKTSVEGEPKKSRSRTVKPKAEEAVQPVAAIAQETNVPVKPKSKKEIAQEEAARIFKAVDGIANINAAYELRNTKKFPQSDQEVFADKATPEQKSKLASVIARDIETLGVDTSEAKELMLLHEAMIGKKYVAPKQSESEPETPQEQSPVTGTAGQNATRSQPTTSSAENPPASTNKRSSPSPQEIKKSLGQKIEAITNELNGFNISLKEANKQIADISKSSEGQAYLMADTTYKNLKEQIQNAPPKSSERTEIQRKLELRTGELLSRAGVRPLKGLNAPEQGDNSNLGDRQKRNKIESIAKGYEDRIAEIKSRNGNSAPPKGSQDASEKAQLEAKLTTAKEQLKTWDKKLEVDRRREDIKALRESIKNTGSEQPYPENVLSSLKESGVKLSAFNKMEKEAQIEAVKQAIAFQRQRIEELKGGDKTSPQTSNDAIATSEAYLAAYWETRDKFRRVS